MLQATERVYGPRAVRIQRRVSLPDLAKRAGYSIGYVRQIERAWEIVCMGGKGAKGYELATIAAAERITHALSCLSPTLPPVRYEVFWTMPPQAERHLWGASARSTPRRKAVSSRPARSNGRAVSSKSKRGC